MFYIHVVFYVVFFLIIIFNAAFYIIFYIVFYSVLHNVLGSALHSDSWGSDGISLPDFPSVSQRRAAFGRGHRTYSTDIEHVPLFLLALSVKWQLERKRSAPGSG